MNRRARWIGERWSRLTAKGLAEPRPFREAVPGLARSVRASGREGLRDDAAAALTLLAIAIPEQLATARLAGMPVITGLYAFIAGSVAFAFLGASRQMSVGADSTIAPLFAIGIGHIAGSTGASYVDLVSLLAICVGVIVAAAGLLRMGWVAEFLSAPIITGFMGGVAIIIVLHQLPDVLGLAPVSGSNLHRVVAVVAHAGGVQAWPVCIAVAVFAAVAFAERVDRRLPMALVAVVATTVVVAAASLERHGVAVLGDVPHGAPRFGLYGVTPAAILHVLPIAGVVALVVISQSAATARAFAGAGAAHVDVGRDFVGVGVGSVVAGLVGSFPVDASPPRTAAVVEAGGRTQLAGLAAAAVMVGVVPAIGLLRDLPLAALAAVLVFIATRIFHLRDFVAIARFDLFEFALALVTLAAVAFIGVEQGIGVAIALAVVDRTRLAIQPRLHVLGRVPGTTSWVPVAARPEALPLPGVLVALFSTPLWYANASHFHDEVLAALDAHGEPLAVFVLDVVGMGDLDYTGAAALRSVLAELDRRHVAFALARTGDRVRTGLERSGILAGLGADRLFGSVDEAIVALVEPAP